MDWLAYLMTMEISKRSILTNVLKILDHRRSPQTSLRDLDQILVLAQLFIELVLLYISNQDKIFLEIRLHKATNHGLIVVTLQNVPQQDNVSFGDLLVCKQVLLSRLLYSG